MFCNCLTHAVVEELAGLGAKVHTCSRNEAYLNACLLDWEIKGFQVTGSVCDVMCRGKRVKLMDTVLSVFSRSLNILVSLSSVQFKSLFLISVQFNSLHST